jgi:myo-inositol 2-dehydrogenase / D-chiro-inositol 1-dehydrogenase
MNRARTRMGLIGSGRIGQVHARNVAENPETELCLVADPVIEGANELTARYGGTATGDPGTLIAAEELDAVIVASPTDTHVELIARCLDAGVPVLCEKPIDLDIDRVRALRPAVTAGDTPVALGFNQRFDPAFAELRRRVADGEIGDLEHLSIVSRDPGPPPPAYLETSGGIFRDMTIHDFDMARFFLGEIAEVSATGACLFDDGARLHGDFDTIVVTLTAASGALATITNSRHSSIGYDQRMEALGERGMLQVANAPSSLVSRSRSDGVDVRGPYIEYFIERYAAAYARELAEFVSLVRGEPSASPTFADGEAALLVADAAQKSAETGRTVRL